MLYAGNRHTHKRTTVCRGSAPWHNNSPFDLCVLCYCCVLFQVPCARLIEVGEEMKRYKPEFDGLDEEKLKQFVQDYTDGKVKVSTVLVHYQQ